MICVPIVGPSMEKALEDLHRAHPLADLVELRLDLIDRPGLAALLKAATRPAIVTHRTKLEGGQFSGSEAERVRALRQAIDLGAPYIDIEASTAREHLQPILENKGSTKVILSYHDFSKTLDDLTPLYDIMRELPADILKIVTYAQDINDNLRMFKLLERANGESRPLIALCMGERGEISRILSPLYGGFLTFGALESGKESAPGQILASTLRGVYRLGLPRENGFRVYGVIGNPVAKSKGYLVHNRAFSEAGSPDIYIPFLVDNAGRFFEGFRKLVSGFSVTMPFKEDIPRYLDRVEEGARKIGAVNTVVRGNEGWVGHNTDGLGALRALEGRVSLKDKNVLILGSGGTAKAIGHAVAGRGARLTVTYRSNPERGRALACDLGGEAVPNHEAGARSVDVLINCSPVGMSPNIHDTPFAARHLRSGMVVFDSVYNPPETRLIREARAAGCDVIPGAELFIHQAALQFELWTGRPAPVAAMREALAAS
ncbi:MAG: shikimate dehydrogenase [Nitrospinaceae bacterium]|nr:MAG: shikimate dehydrogenase [Nitrospinaceae bacterium]